MPVRVQFNTDCLSVDVGRLLTEHAYPWRPEIRFPLSLISNTVGYADGLLSWLLMSWLWSLGTKWLSQSGLEDIAILKSYFRSILGLMLEQNLPENCPCGSSVPKESTVVWVVIQARALEPVWLPWWECRGAHLTLTKQPPVPGGDDVEMPKLTLGNMEVLNVEAVVHLGQPVASWKNLNE